MSEVGGRVRLTLAGLTQAEGTTLQEAADDLVRRVLLIAMAFRASGIGTARDAPRATMARSRLSRAWAHGSSP